MQIRKGFEKEWKELVAANQGAYGKPIINFVQNVATECEKDLNNLTIAKFDAIVKKQPEYESFSGAAYSMAEITLYGMWEGSWKLKELFPKQYEKFEKNNPEFKWPEPQMR